MSNRSKVILIIFSIYAFCLIVILIMPRGSDTDPGIPASKFGSRDVFIEPPEGRLILSDSAEIAARFPWAGYAAAVIIGDSTRPDVPAVFIDYPEVDSLGDFADILEELENDTSVNILHKNDSRGRELTILFSVGSDEIDSVSYVYIKYRDYYPNYLRIRAVWGGSRTIPMSVAESMAAVKVR